MKDQKELTAKYFDEISGNYQDKYSSKKLLHEYIFKNRLKIAIAQKAFAGGSVLDVGAGSGALYSKLIGSDNEINYRGCDISAGMLESSGIPSQQQFVGSCYQIEEFKNIKFDVIFMLGVTTYMDREELAKNMDFVASALSERGVFIVSFTNRLSLNRRMRVLIKSVYKFFKGSRGKGVISQDFETHAYFENDVVKILETNFDKSMQVEYYNFIFFPISHLLQRFSVSLSNFIARRFSKSIKKYFAAEFILVCKR